MTFYISVVNFLLHIRLFCLCTNNCAALVHAAVVSIELQCGGYSQLCETLSHNSQDPMPIHISISLEKHTFQIFFESSGGLLKVLQLPVWFGNEMQTFECLLTKLSRSSDSQSFRLLNFINLFQKLIFCLLTFGLSSFKELKYR